MKYVFAITLFSIGALFSIERQKISFIQAQEAAVAYSERLSIAELETLVAREKIEEIRGGSLPKLSVDATANFRSNEPGFIRKNPAYEEALHKDQNAPASAVLPPKYLKTIAAQRQGANGKVSL